MILESNILDLLALGPLSMSELCSRLGSSQPTLSRLLRRLGDQLIVFGGARRGARYARKRSINGLDQFPLYRINQEGRIAQIGILYPVWEKAYIYRDLNENSGKLFDGLPWFIQDMIPQGFLGRAFAHANAGKLGLGSDLSYWKNEDFLWALEHFGQDCVGNLVLGNQSYQRFLDVEEIPAIKPEDRVRIYPELAQRAVIGDVVGSSAGGEQAKFSSCVKRDGSMVHVLVKFTVDTHSDVTLRWRSLLMCEFLALRCLNEHGIAAAEADVFDIEEQRFLETERFDRIGALGRRGLVSLRILDAEFIGNEGNWLDASRALLKLGKISQTAFEGICRLYVFGLLIGNSDMHGGNLSFFHDGSMPLELAPAYDMLPMYFAPRNSGELKNTLPNIKIEAQPDAGIWREIFPLALRYWKTVASNSSVDEGFCKIAEGMGSHISTLHERFITRVG